MLYHTSTLNLRIIKRTSVQGGSSFFVHMMIMNPSVEKMYPWSMREFMCSVDGTARLIESHYLKSGLLPFLQRHEYCTMT